VDIHQLKKNAQIPKNLWRGIYKLRVLFTTLNIWQKLMDKYNKIVFSGWFVKTSNFHTNLLHVLNITM